MAYMAKLGDFAFSINTAAPQGIDRQTTHRWEEQQRVGRKPAQQSVGQGADVITLEGVIYPHFKGGIGQVGRMRAMAGNGKPLALIYAFESAGQYNGLWCIRNVSEKRTVFFQDGTPRKIEFSLELVEYGADATATPGQALVPTVTAVAGGAKVEAASVLSAAKVATDQASALSVAGRVGSVLSSVGETVSTAYKAFQASDAGQVLRTVVTKAGNVNAAIVSLKNASTAIKAAGNNPAAVLDALQGAAGAAGSAAGVFGSVATALGANADLVNGASAVTQYTKEVSTAAGDFRDVTDAANNIRNTANILKGVLGG